MINVLAIKRNNYSDSQTRNLPRIFPRRAVLVLIILALLTGSISFAGKWQAESSAHAFARAINDNNPGVLYSYLLPEIQKMLTKEEFVKNFAHERSYPYLSPLYIYLDEINLTENKKTGEAVFTVAARLPGEKMRVKFQYINGHYFFDYFREIANGSYIEKFKKLKK